MFKLVSFVTVALGAAAMVSGAAVPRDHAPSSYNSAILEPYDAYSSRYDALDCADKHGSSFFDDCCHPLMAGQSLSDRPDYCTPPAASSSSSAAPAATPAPVQNAAVPPPPVVDVEKYSGHGTWFYQHGVAGACGTVHSETDKVIALDTAMYGNLGAVSDHCGKAVMITNTKNGQQVQATVADACPTCDAAGSIDLSQGAFEALASLDEGLLEVEWHFL